MNIIIKGKDGSVAIMSLAEGAGKEEAVQKFKAAHEEGFYTDYFEHEGELPENREFRDAWTLHGSKIVVDEIKAKIIHMERVRNARDVELEKLDREQMKHLGSAKKIKELSVLKQALRDLPASVNGLDWPPTLLKSV